MDKILIFIGNNKYEVLKGHSKGFIIERTADGLLAMLTLDLEIKHEVEPEVSNVVSLDYYRKNKIKKKAVL